MKAMVTKYGKATDRPGAQMTHAQALTLKRLAEEANQPAQYGAS